MVKTLVDNIYNLFKNLKKEIDATDNKILNTVNEIETVFIEARLIADIKMDFPGEIEK